MLPITVQFIVATLAYALNERMARKAEYLREENRQGIGNRIIQPNPSPSNDNGNLGPIRCRSRLGGLLNFYHQEAA